MWVSYIPNAYTQDAHTTQIGIFRLFHFDLKRRWATSLGRLGSRALGGRTWGFAAQSLVFGASAAGVDGELLCGGAVGARLGVGWALSSSLFFVFSLSFQSIRFFMVSMGLGQGIFRELFALLKVFQGGEEGGLSKRTWLLGHKKGDFLSGGALRTGQAQLLWGAQEEDAELRGAFDWRGEGEPKSMGKNHAKNPKILFVLRLKGPCCFQAFLFRAGLKSSTNKGFLSQNQGSVPAKRG